MLGLLDKTQSESRKIERKMSDKCLESKRGTTSATMETQRGATAPLVSSMSQDPLSPLQISRAASHGRWMGQCGSPWLSKRHKHTNERAAQKSPFSLSVPQQITLDSRLLRSSVLHRSAQFSFSFSDRLLSPTSRYHLHSDIQSLSVLKSKSALL